MTPKRPHATSKLALIALTTSIILILSACGSDQEATTTTAADSTTTTTTATTSPDPVTPPAGGFVPSQPMPADFPVFPGAVMWSDVSSGGDAHLWLFNSTGTAEEILAFYEASLRELGITEIETGAIHEEFFLHAQVPGHSPGGFVAPIVIGFLDDGLPEPVTPQTPGRGFMLQLNLAAWGGR